MNQKFADWLGFKTFGDKALEKAVLACQEWAYAFKAGVGPRWLSLIGNSGTGKTHCCNRLFKWASRRIPTGKTVHRDGACFHDDTAYAPRAIYWPDFVQRLRSGNSFNERDDMKRWPVLFLDDIGAERDPSGFAAEELNTLLGCRTAKWTLITSNKDMAGITAIDARIGSRLIRDKNICVSIKTKDFSTR